MKKIVLAASILATVSITTAYAQKSKISITTSNDSLSYAYGANLVNQGLMQYLNQLGITTDGTSDNKDVSVFVKALKEGLMANKEERVHITGLGVGDQVYKMAEGLAKQADSGDLNLALIAQAIEDALLKNTPLISDSETIFQQKMEDINKKASEKQREGLAPQIEAGTKFMEDNKTKDGVVVLPSGLQYKIETKGNGDIPTASDNVKVHYKGMLLDGTVFDSSYDRGEPIVLEVSQVIPGWTEALQLMPVGSKWILYIPYDLAYGEHGASAAIPPYSNLVFEIELLDIIKN